MQLVACGRVCMRGWGEGGREGGGAPIPYCVKRGWTHLPADSIDAIDDAVMCGSRENGLCQIGGLPELQLTYARVNTLTRFEACLLRSYRRLDHGSRQCGLLPTSAGSATTQQEGRMLLPIPYSE